jgi:hypothetical protein
MMIKLGSSTVIGGEKLTVEKFLDEPNTGLCNIEFNEWTFTLPVEIVEAAFFGSLQRADNAGRGMVEAHINDWLERDLDWEKKEAFDFSRELGKVLVGLEEEGFLVMLRHEAACWHCGTTWPRRQGDPHVTLCKSCTEEQLARAPDKEKLEELCQVNEAAMRAGLPATWDKPSRETAEAQAEASGRVVVEKQKT